MKTLIGPITEKQKALLIRQGRDPEAVNTWTKQAAFEEIARIINGSFNQQFANWPAKPFPKPKKQKKKKTKKIGRSRSRPLTREDKAARTRGIKLLGRMTLAQQQLLLKLGADGDKIEKYTKHRAQLEITKRLGSKSKDSGQTPTTPSKPGDL